MSGKYVSEDTKLNLTCVPCIIPCASSLERNVYFRFCWQLLAGNYYCTKFDVD